MQGTKHSLAFSICLWLLVTFVSIVPTRRAAGQAAPAAASGPKLELRGEHRMRYESLDGQFRPLPDPRDQALALHTSLRLRAEWTRWQVDGEVLDSRHYLNDAGSVVTAGMVNALEPTQLYATRSWDDLFQPGASSTLSFGRITPEFGRRRLLARHRYRNTNNSFLGFDWQWRSAAGRQLRALAFRPMRALPSTRAELIDNEFELDRANRHTRLVGLYYRTPLPTASDALELYWLSLDASRASAPRDLDTFGLRVFRPAPEHGFSYEIELMDQNGRSTGPTAGGQSTSLDHDASFAHVELGFTFDGAWSPTLLAFADEASGDDDPTDGRNGRFDALYGPRSELGLTGIYGPVSRANLSSRGLRLGIEPGARWDASVTLRSYALESARDAWTTTGLRDPSGAAGRSIGDQLELRFRWRIIDDRLGFDGGLIHLRKGRFVELTAPAVAGDTNYLHAALTVSF